MSDDLTAFFAKKASKSKDRKKKGVINIEDVGQQLERKAKIQEEGDYQGDEQERKSSMETTSKSNLNAEDSEWIDFNEKPSLEKFTFKEFKEPNEDELEEEKRRMKEPNKTWNIVEPQKEISVENVVTKPAKFVVRGQTRAEKVPDLNNQEMFPSIADAGEVEKIQKALEEERRNEFEEQKKKEEERKRVEDEKRSKFNSYTPTRQRQQDQSEITLSPDSRKPFQRSTSPTAPKNIEQSAADDADTWRRDKAPTPARVLQMTEATIVQKTPSITDDSKDWRSNQPSSEQQKMQYIAPSTRDKTGTPAADESGAWRSSKPSSAQKSASDEWQTVEPKKSTTNESVETTATNSTQPGKYVPPWMRNKQ